MYNRRRFNRGVLAVSFGMGLLVSSLCPTKAMLMLLAIAIVCLGISCTKC